MNPFWVGLRCCAALISRRHSNAALPFFGLIHRQLAFEISLRFVPMNLRSTRQRLGVLCRAERIHCFDVDTFHRRNPMFERSFQSKSGNVAGSGVALQDLAEHSKVRGQIVFY